MICRVAGGIFYNLNPDVPCLKSSRDRFALIAAVLLWQTSAHVVTVNGTPSIFMPKSSPLTQTAMLLFKISVACWDRPHKSSKKM